MICVDRNLEKMELSYTGHQNINGQPLWKTVCRIKKKNIHLPHDGFISIPGISPRERKIYGHTNTSTQVSQ